MSGVQSVQLSLAKASIAAWERCSHCLSTAKLRRCLIEQVYFTQLQITSIHDQPQPQPSLLCFHSISKFDKQLKQDAPVRQHSAQFPGKPSGA